MVTEAGPHSYADNKLSEQVRNAEPPWMDQTGYDRNRLVLFTHVPKAGGTSLKQALTTIYGRHFQDHHPRLNNVAEQFADDKLVPHEIQALSSHIPFGYHRRIQGFSDRLILPVTIVRDPIDRMVSYYNFIQTFPPHRLHRETKGLDIDEFFKKVYEIQGRKEISDGQSKVVSGAKRTFASAKDALEQEYFGYAALSSLDVFVTQLSDALGWPEREETTGKANQSPRLAGLDDMSDETHSMLLELNQQDAQLHEYLKNAGPTLRTDLLER